MNKRHEPTQADACPLLDLNKVNTSSADAVTNRGSANKKLLGPKGEGSIVVKTLTSLEESLPESWESSSVSKIVGNNQGTQGTLKIFL